AEDVMADPLKTLGAVCERLGLRATESLRTPSWNGLPLAEVYPWGTIRVATTEANRSTALELTGEERADLRARTRPFLDVFDYQPLREEVGRGRRTGGAGSGGATPARRLLREGHEVHVTIRPGADPWRLEEIRDDVDVSPVDLGDAETLRAIVDRVRP